MCRFECFNRNGKKVEILNNIVTKQINLCCLDMSCVLKSKLDNDLEEIHKKKIINRYLSEHGFDVSENKDVKNLDHFSFKYCYAFSAFEDNLKKKFEKYIKAIREIDLSKVDKEKYKKDFNEEDEQILSKLDKDIEDRIFNGSNSKYSKYHLYIESQARELLNENFNNKEKNGEMLKKLISYIKYKNADHNINEGEKTKESHKLILI